MNSTEYFELSNPQRRIWLTEVLHNHVDMSNIGYLIEFKGEYCLERLAQAIKIVVKANKGLHLRFKYSEQDKSELLQYIPPFQDIEVEIIKAKDEKELFTQIEALHHRRFDLSSPFHCGFAVFSIAGKRFGFVEKAHHLVADGISATIVAREVIETYQKLDTPDFVPLQKEHSYLDFLKGEQEYIQGEKYQKEKEFWLKEFNDFAGREITFELNKGKKNSLKVKRRSYQVPAERYSQLETYQTTHRISNFHLFMAALAIYFNRYMNHQDIVIGMPVHNRSQKIYRDMVGMFVSTIPLRLRFDETWSFNQLIAHLKAGLWEALKHQGYPYNHLVKDLKEIDIDSSGFLNVQLIELPGANHEEIDKRVFFSTAYNISQLSIYLNQQNRKDLQELDIAVDYHMDLFDEQEIDVFFQRIFTILRQAIGEPERPLSELSLLEEKEYRHLITELNNTTAPFPGDQTLPALFEVQAARTPDSIALEYQGETVTYSRLNLLADRLAGQLIEAGIHTGDIVGMLCERSIEAVVSILGIQKAGGAYLPIDPEYPLDRKNYIITDSRMQILLVEKILASQEQPLLQSNPAVKTITVEEVKSEEDEGTEVITSEQVEAARMMTDERWYGLLCLWGLIILAIVLIRLQVRDDEKLYEEGYYSREIE